MAYGAETNWREFFLWLIGILAVAILTAGFVVLAFRSADDNRQKEIDLMQTCTEAGGTWLGDISTCVQPVKELQ